MAYTLWGEPDSGSFMIEGALAEAFPRAASLAVPLPCLAYRDMVVEIEAVAVAEPPG